MLLAVPSKGRAGKVKTAEVLPSVVIYCPQDEVRYYRRSNPEQSIVGVPKSVRGITATRNWILNNTDDLRVVMVDDDVRDQGWFELLERNAKRRRMTAADWLSVCGRMFDCVEDLGWKLWGVATDGALRSVYPYHPVLARGYITASFMGIVNDGSYRFDESYIVKEDYEICLRHIRDFGGVLCARFCFWANDHWASAGGCKDYRSGVLELQMIQKLLTDYAGMIRRVTRGGSSYSIELDF